MCPSSLVTGEYPPLECFNVRVLYDKLEDQNLHLAAQLARQKEDLSSFYNHISAQNDELHKLLDELDPEKLKELEQREATIERDVLRGAASFGDNSGLSVVNASIAMSGGTGRMKYASEFGLIFLNCVELNFYACLGRVHLSLFPATLCL